LHIHSGLLCGGRAVYEEIRMAKTAFEPSDLLLPLLLIALSILCFACAAELVPGGSGPGDGDTAATQRDQSGGTGLDQDGSTGSDRGQDQGVSADRAQGGSTDLGKGGVTDHGKGGVTDHGQGAGPADSAGSGGVDRSGVLEQAAGGWVDQGLIKPGVSSTGTGWGTLRGDSCPSKTIQLKNFLTYYWSAGGQWILAQDASQGSIGSQISITKQPDGSFTVISLANKSGGGTDWGHFWINEAGNFPADTQGVFVTMDVLGPTGCSMDVGFDWWSGASGVVGNLQAKPLTGSWRSYAFSSVPLATLKSNPPPGY
jgi:hypothetical protein